MGPKQVQTTDELDLQWTLSAVNFLVINNTLQVQADINIVTKGIADFQLIK